MPFRGVITESSAVCSSMLSSRIFNVRVEVVTDARDLQFGQTATFQHGIMKLDLSATSFCPFGLLLGYSCSDVGRDRSQAHKPDFMTQAALARNQSAVSASGDLYPPLAPKCESSSRRALHPKKSNSRREFDTESLNGPCASSGSKAYRKAYRKCCVKFQKPIENVALSAK